MQPAQTQEPSSSSSSDTSETHPPPSLPSTTTSTTATPELGPLPTPASASTPPVIDTSVGSSDPTPLHSNAGGPQHAYAKLDSPPRMSASSVLASSPGLASRLNAFSRDRLLSPNPAPLMTDEETLDLSPWAKCFLFGKFPWKLLLHVLLTLSTTAHVLLINAVFDSYSRSIGSTWAYLLFPDGYRSYEERNEGKVSRLSPTPTPSPSSP